MRTHEAGLAVPGLTTETGERCYGTSLMFTSTGSSIGGVFDAPWTLNISHEGTPVTTEPYESQPEDLDWVPPEDPSWGDRGGTYDYEWSPN